MKKGRVAVPMLVGLLVAGCAPLLGRGDSEDLSEEERPRTLSVEVENQNFYDATIYAIQPGLRLRVGRVGGNMTDTFQFRWPYLDLRFEIDLLAVGSYYSYSMAVEQGDELGLIVLPDLHHRSPGAVF